MDKVKPKRLFHATDAGANDGNGIPTDDTPVAGKWKNLCPELLALIFLLIPAEEMVRVVPLVCKSWREVVAGHYCWVDIDTEHWSRQCSKACCIDETVGRLVLQSECLCRRISVCTLGECGFSSVVSCARCLKVLEIPMSLVSDKILKKHIQSLPMLTFLDISYCLKVTCEGLEALGKSCTALVHLRRNLFPLKFDFLGFTLPRDDGEALVIAETMHKLQRLELGYGYFTDLGLAAILTKCKNLSHLDIDGCWNVQLEGNLDEICKRLEEFIGPLDNYELLEFNCDNDYL